MTDSTIRPAVAADAPAVTACVTAAYAIYVERMGQPPGPMLDDYAAVIAEHIVFVLTEDGTIAGVVVLIRQDGSLLLDNVAVYPDRQGRGYVETERRRVRSYDRVYMRKPL